MQWNFELIVKPGEPPLTEGPVWDGEFLYFTHIRASRILRYDPKTGAVTVAREGTNRTNGLAHDQQGRLYGCCSGGRSVVRFDDDRIVTLCDNFEGKRLNSPNDLVYRSDGALFFTDPPFGIQSNYEGVIAEQEIPANVYRIDGKTGARKWSYRVSDRSDVYPSPAIDAEGLKVLPARIAAEADGSRVTLELGGTLDPARFTPVRYVGRARRIDNPNVVFAGGVGDGLIADLGVAGPFAVVVDQQQQVLAAAVSVKDESEADMLIVAGRTPALSGVPVASHISRNGVQ